MLPADMEQHFSRLRRAIAKSEALPEEVRPLALGVAEIDAALGGGLSRAALHELSATPLHLGAAAGFALTLAALASEQAKQTLWIATDFGMLETGALYGPGLDQIGLATERLLVVRVARPVDALFAAEEALKCRALSAVVAEIDGEADLTATRRLSALRRARAARSACCCATSRAMRRARPSRAGRSPARRACRMNSAASAAPPSISRSRATAAAPAAPGHSPGIIMSASSRRYLSVWLRRLPTDRIAKRFPPEALVIAAPVKGALRLSAVNDAAAALGLRVGMPLADARAMYPKLAVADADERPTSRCSKRSRTGATAIRRWSGSIRPMGSCSTFPAARICSAARRRWRTI